MTKEDIRLAELNERIAFAALDAYYDTHPAEGCYENSPQRLHWLEMVDRRVKAHADMSTYEPDPYSAF
jgi:hypothetical protein